MHCSLGTSIRTIGLVEALVLAPPDYHPNQNSLGFLMKESQPKLLGGGMTQASATLPLNSRRRSRLEASMSGSLFPSQLVLSPVSAVSRPETQNGKPATSNTEP